MELGMEHVIWIRIRTGFGTGITMQEPILVLVTLWIRT